MWQQLGQGRQQYSQGRQWHSSAEGGPWAYTVHASLTAECWWHCVLYWSGKHCTDNRYTAHGGLIDTLSQSQMSSQFTAQSVIVNCDVMLKFMITGCTLTLTDSGSSLTFDAQRDHQVAASNVYTFKRVKYEITTFSLTELTVIFFLWLRVREIYAHEIDYQRKRVSCVCVCERDRGGGDVDSQRWRQTLSRWDSELRESWEREREGHDHLLQLRVQNKSFPLELASSSRTLAVAHTWQYRLSRSTQQPAVITQCDATPSSHKRIHTKPKCLEWRIKSDRQADDRSPNEARPNRSAFLSLGSGSNDNAPRGPQCSPVSQSVKNGNN